MSGHEQAREIVLQTLLLEAIEAADLAVCVYDEDGRYVTVNSKACELLGYTRDELLAHDVADFTEGGIDRALLHSDDHREGVRRVTRRDGSTTAVAFVVVPTRVARLPYYLAVWWELPEGDARAEHAA